MRFITGGVDDVTAHVRNGMLPSTGC